MNTQYSNALTLKCDLHVQRQEKGRRQLRMGKPPTIKQAPMGRVPRLARLMALAVRFDDLLRLQEVQDYAELARLGHVTRARVTQIMNLLNLAPDLQEELLFLPLTQTGRDRLKEWQLRPIAAEVLWSTQRRLWRKLVK